MAVCVCEGEIIKTRSVTSQKTLNIIFWFVVILGCEPTAKILPGSSNLTNHRRPHLCQPISVSASEGRCSSVIKQEVFIFVTTRSYF